jgi:rare lipoprotein A (peptidoglycan hydrolase)
MRRTWAALAVAGALVTPAVSALAPAPAAATTGGDRPLTGTAATNTKGSAPPTSQGSDIRARRAAVLVRIAELTDRVEDSQAHVVAAQFEETRLSDASAAVRARVRARAVAAFINGFKAPDQMATPRIYLQVAARKEQALLHRYRASMTAVADHQAKAEETQRDLAGAARQLNEARQELDTLVQADDARLRAAQQAAEQRAADAARRRAQLQAASAAVNALGAFRAGSPGGSTGVVVDEASLLPRHRNATRRQAELMTQYLFGVLAAGPLPATLASTGQAFSGQASWYGGMFNGRPTASGAIYDQEGWTAASRTLPLGTMIVVSRNGVRVLLLVNDRGPYVDGRVLDLSAAAARVLGVGVSTVDVEVVAPR